MAVSRYNDYYYCNITQVEHVDAILRVHFNAHGDNSLGSLQDPTHSKIFSPSFPLGINPSRHLYTASEATHFAGWLEYGVGSSPGPFTFSYGMSGYTTVPLPKPPSRVVTLPTSQQPQQQQQQPLNKAPLPPLASGPDKTIAKPSAKPASNYVLNTGIPKPQPAPSPIVTAVLSPAPTSLSSSSPSKPSTNFAPVLQLPTVAVSRYNDNYYCNIAEVEHIDNILRVYFNVHGDGSLGQLQEPHFSNLFSPAFPQGITPSSRYYQLRDPNSGYTGWLDYNVGSDNGPFQFSYGSSGYSLADLPPAHRVVTKPQSRDLWADPTMNVPLPPKPSAPVNIESIPSTPVFMPPGKIICTCWSPGRDNYVCHITDISITNKFMKICFTSYSGQGPPDDPTKALLYTPSDSQGIKPYKHSYNFNPPSTTSGWLEFDVGNQVGPFQFAYGSEYSRINLPQVNHNINTLPVNSSIGPNVTAVAQPITNNGGQPDVNLYNPSTPNPNVNVEPNDYDEVKCRQWLAANGVPPLVNSLLAHLLDQQPDDVVGTAAAFMISQHNPSVAGDSQSSDRVLHFLESVLVELQSYVTRQQKQFATSNSWGLVQTRLVDCLSSIEKAASGSSTKDAPLNNEKFTTPASSLLTKVKQATLKQVSGTRSLFRILHQMNSSGSGRLSKSELQDGLRTFGVESNNEGLEEIMKWIDIDGSGDVSIDEFVYSLRGPLSQRRSAIVSSAFRHIDVKGSGQVLFSEMMTKYDASKHPRVLTNECTQELMMQEFVTSWDWFPNSTININDFMAYYADVSASTDDDEYFDLLVKNGWRVPSAPSPNRRLLVTHVDGRQSIQFIKGDLGIAPTDLNKMKRKLEEQGVKDYKIVVFV